MRTTLASRPGARLAAFAAAGVAAAGLAALLGAAVGPIRAGGGAGGAHGDAGAGVPGGDHGPVGSAVGEGGPTLRLERGVVPRGRPTLLAFRVEAAGGANVRAFDVTHERRMHLILVRRDLTGFRHLHPTMDPRGRWTVRVRLSDPGVYRVYADFRTDGEDHTLAADLTVPGPLTPVALAAPAPTATTGAYSATLDAAGLRAGREARLDYALRLRGRAVTPAPYLGAGGHLVALREGDGAFVHVHPEEGDAPGVVGFAATFPTAGRYRLFLQFRHGGAVRTVAHTVEVPR